MPSKKRYCLPSIISFSFLILLGLLYQPGMAASSEQETELPLPALDMEFEPELGTYYYKAEWNLINVGKASIEISKEDSLYKMIVHARTSKKIDIIYKLRYRGESVMDGQSMAPVEVNMQQNVKSKKKNTIMEFKGDGTIKTTESKKRRGKPEEKTVTEIQPIDFHLDPFSATCLVRRLDWEVGVADVFDIVLGTKMYELKLLCTEETVIESAGKNRKVYVIVPELTRKDGEDKKASDGNLRIFLSADELKEVLKIDANHKLGSFKVVLEKFVPTVSTKEPTHTKEPTQ